MLQQWNLLNIEDVQAKANSYWGYGTTNTPAPLIIENLDPENNDVHKTRLFKHVCSEMISKVVKENLTMNSFKILLLIKRDFNWTKYDGTTCYDGPTMILICLQLVNPSTNIGVEKYISKIEQATMSKYGNKLPEILDYMKLFHN